MTTLLEEACGVPVCPTQEDFQRRAHLLVDDTIDYAPTQDPVEITANDQGNLIINSLGEGVQKICRFFGDTLISKDEGNEIVKDLSDTMIIHGFKGDVYHSRAANSSAVVARLLGNITRCASFLKS